MADRRRDDPYKNFNFRLTFGAALAALAGFAIVRKVVPGVAKKYRKPSDYVSEVPSGSRPIEGVGTSVAAGRKRPKPKPKTKRASSGSAVRKSPRRKSGGGAKRR